MISYEGVLDAVEPHGHTVQLYGTDAGLLARSVGRYFRQALDSGKAVLIAATQSHAELFSRAFSRADLQHITFLDAHDALCAILVNGLPDRKAFENTVGRHVRALARDNPHGVRAYGELVGVLWDSGERDAAAQLEALWNELMQEVNFELYCAYPIDVFGPDFELASLDAIMCGHSHLRAARRNDDLFSALRRAMDRVLGSRAQHLLPLMQPNHRPAWGAVPRGEALILWLRNNLPEEAERIIADARVDFMRTAPAT